MRGFGEGDIVIDAMYIQGIAVTKMPNLTVSAAIGWVVRMAVKE
jgi:hypothetical protein